MNNLVCPITKRRYEPGDYQIRSPEVGYYIVSQTVDYTPELRAETEAKMKAESNGGGTQLHNDADAAAPVPEGDLSGDNPKHKR